MTDFITISISSDSRME